MKKFKVSNECISCRACVEIAGDNFDINDNNIAFLKKQPESDSELELCNEALDACPVQAISSLSIESATTTTIKPILGESNIKEILDQYPDLKQILIELSPKFKRMQTPALYNTLARFASFNDAAKMTGISVCEILHTINKHLGLEDKLIKSMPECVKQINEHIDDNSIDITWEENAERYIYNNDTVEELINKISDLPAQKNIVIIATEQPNELLKVVNGLELVYNIEKGREYRISIFNPQQETQNIPWQERKDDFELLDVSTMTSDPFDIIIKKAYETIEDSGFILRQNFEPLPIINMLSEMGFEHLSEQKEGGKFSIYFYKKISEQEEEGEAIDKIDAVIQSATPVAYPVIMRLLQSEKIRKSINIKQLKVWEETEKHLAWITNGKADISFSALITSAKLRNSDIKIPALFVWDNFVLLSRSKVNGFEDIKGKEIHTPLFEEAPPAKITKYLIKASGLKAEDFNFVYGKPFGRPEKIYKDFVVGKADTVIRFGSFPNAGLVLKGEFARKYPEQTKVLLEELKSAINWVNENRKASAELSFDMMRQPVNRIELFLDRVNFEYVEGEPLIKKVKQYFDILNKNEIVNMKIDEEFLDVFRMDK